MDKYQKVFDVFEKNYVLVPLEIFKDDPFQSLVATMMSARTNDDTTVVAAQKLFSVAPTAEKLAALPVEEIAKLIYPVGFYKTKAKQLKEIAQTITTTFGGNVPQTREELVSLPGVGRKTANLVMNRAFGIPAIAVDTHVHRITNMLGWVHTKTPEQTELALLATLPEKYWTQTNNLFVSIGRQFRSIPKLTNFLKENGLL
ncbi:endonuclease III [Candidatus Woesebacteria bacterium]|nr:endonuclease III [Candidatus Woesebacteria bacterium]MBP9687031.1 endonuclease III [Candidatus Woesebacteria bacterium]